MSQPQPALRFSKKRPAVAFAVALSADVLSKFFILAPPVQWGIDLVTALLLFMVLGWQWMLLPGLILEAIPGINILPFWVLVVGAVALLGTMRPDRNALRHAAQAIRKFWMQRNGPKEPSVKIGSPDRKA